MTDLRANSSAQKFSLPFLATLTLSLLFAFGTSHAQVTNITSSGLRTTLNGSEIVPCAGSCDITGGTRPGGGTNLFHSFGRFNVGQTLGVNDIANFMNVGSFDSLGNLLPDGLPTNNIIGRVTDGVTSQIYGTLQTTGFGSAALWLINPAGVVFGATATLNVGGSVNISTADYLRLTDGARLEAIPGAQDALLSSAPVAAFGFVAANPAAIEVQAGSALSVQPGQALSLVGGDVTVTGPPPPMMSTLSAPGGQINLTSVAGPGEVAADTAVPAEGMGLGTITLGQDSVLSTASVFVIGDESGGAVSIRGGQLVATGATIRTSPADGSVGSGGAVTIDVAGSATLTNSTIQTGPSAFFFAGSAGAVSITADTGLTVTNTTIDTSTFFALGDSGPVTLTTNGLLSATDSTILTRSDISGNAGAVTLTGKDITLVRSTITTEVTGDPGLGLDMVSSGAVTVTGQDSVTISGSSVNDVLISTHATATLLDASQITVAGRTVTLSNGKLDVGMSDSGFTVSSNGGTIEIQGNNVSLTQFKLLGISDFSAGSTGAGGQVRLRGFDNVLADNIQLTASEVNTSAGGGGGGGPIEFQARTLTISGNTDVGTSSFGSGAGGSITLRGTDNVTIESGSRVLTDVVIGPAGAPQGTAGDILVQTQNLTVRSGGVLRAGALPNSSGNAGNITVQGPNSPAQSILIDGAGSGIFTTTEGTGAGGNINLFSQSVNLNSNAAISASSTGTGDAGNISITANQVNLFDSSITTQAAAVNGGNITIMAGELVRMNNSQINASVQGGMGTTGGNILIDPPFVVLQNNSQILTQAVAGTGGNITIVASGLFIDPTSSISAASQLGISGVITVQSPVFFLSGTLVPLPKNPVQAASLLQQRCAARMQGSGASNFVQRGRDGLPPEPGGWLTSPMLAAGSPPLTPQIGQAEPSPAAASLEGPLTKLASANLSSGCGLELVLAQ